MYKANLKLETLQELAKISNSIVKDVRVNLSIQGIELSAVDGAHIAMLHLQYTDKVYNDVKGDSASICFEIEKLLKTLTLGRIGQIIEIKYDNTQYPTEEENRKKDTRLVLSLSDAVRHMTLLNAESFAQSPEFRKIPLPCYVIVKLEDILQGVGAAQIVASDEITISLSTTNGLLMHSESKGDTFDVKIPKEKLQKFDIKEDVSAIYPLKMLRDVLVELKGVEQLVMYLGTDLPLRLQFDLSGGVGTGRFLLAPRTRQAGE